MRFFVRMINQNSNCAIFLINESQNFTAFFRQWAVTENTVNETKKIPSLIIVKVTQKRIKNSHGNFQHSQLNRVFSQKFELEWEQLLLNHMV